MGKNQTNAGDAGTTNTSSAVVAEPVGAAAATTAAAQVPVATGPTPDNTPLPGGGSWRWDITLPGWVERDVNTGEDIAATGTAE